MLRTLSLVASVRDADAVPDAALLVSLKGSAAAAVVVCVEQPTMLAPTAAIPMKAPALSKSLRVIELSIDFPFHFGLCVSPRTG